MIFRILKYMFFTLVIIIVLIIAACIIITRLYDDKISQYVIAELNKRIRTEVQIKKIEFSLFSKFPRASLNLSGITAKSTKTFNASQFMENTDTLLSAQNLFLQFNILDILHEQYILKKIHLHEGKVNIFIDKQGKNNFHFWEADTSDSSAFQLDLQNILFTQIFFHVHDKSNELNAKSFTEEWHLTGNFSSDMYELGTKGNLIFSQLVINKTNYARSAGISLDLNMNVRDGSYNLSESKVRVGKLLFYIQGQINSGSPSSVNIKISGKTLDIPSFISLLPERYANITKKYRSRGLLSFTSHIRGSVGTGKSPHIQATFSIEEADLTETASKIAFQDITVKGRFNNGSMNSALSSVVQLDCINFSIGESHVDAVFYMENLLHPDFSIEAESDFRLEDLKHLFNNDTLEYINGNLKGSIRIAGKIENFERLSSSDFRHFKTMGKFTISGARIKIRKAPDEYSEIQGGFTFDNNDINIDSLSFRIGRNDFLTSGVIKNIMNYVLKENQTLTVDADIQSEHFFMNDFMDDNDANTLSMNPIVLPERINLFLAIRIGEFTFSRFVASHIKGDLIYNNKRLGLNDLSFHSMNGVITGDATITQTPSNHLLVKTTARLNHIDINKLFYSFHNFNQDFIRDEHMKGNLKADVSLSSEWNSELSVLEESIFAESDIEISNGELNDFDPMMELSSYIKVSELQNIRFSTLKNKIIIKDRKVIIPQMEINSSAFNITLSGSQTFNNEIDYKLKVLLSEVLSGKARKAKKENEQFGVVEDDGLGKTSLFLTIKGTVDDYDISYDTRKTGEHIKENLKEEKKELKQILHEEFGWFKKDSTLIRTKGKQQENKSPVIIKWDEEDPN